MYLRYKPLIFSLENLRSLDHYTYDRAKAVYRLNYRPIDDLEGILDSLERDTVSIKPMLYNKCFIRLLIVDRKSRF
jgi:hypothetical protein